MGRKAQVKENNCSNCGNLLTCPEILTYTCAKYVKAEPGKIKEPEKPVIGISRRNKEIIKLVGDGKSVNEIAAALELTSETVVKELEYLTNSGMLKAGQPKE